MLINDVLSKRGYSSKGHTARNIMIGAGIGSAIGLAAGILLAPKSGKETMKNLENGTKAALNTVKGTVNNVRGKMEHIKPTNYEFNYRYTDGDNAGSYETIETRNNTFEDKIDEVENDNNLVNNFENKDKCCDD